MDRIPTDRPVLIASNHPSAFLEACLLATHFPKSLHFLVRGDIFINKFVIWLLAQLHLTPIYRFADGFKNLRANENTFSDCYKRLKDKEIIVVYAEGNTTQEKRLRPIQKGLAKIAFGALDIYPDMDLCIVPLGVNYTHPNDFRSEVFVEVGMPIELESYFQKYKTESQKAITELTQEIELKMKPLVIHINKDEDLPLAEKLWLLAKSIAPESFWPVLDRSGERFALDKSISLRINDMDEKAKTELQNKILIPLQIPASTGTAIIFIPAMIGKLINFLPFTIATQIAKSKVKRIEFFASVLVGSGMFIYILYATVIAILSHAADIPVVMALGSLVICGLIYLYRDHLLVKQKLSTIRQLNGEIIKKITDKGSFDSVSL